MVIIVTKILYIYTYILGQYYIKPSHHPHYDSVHMQSLREALEVKFLTKLCSL